MKIKPVSEYKKPLYAVGMAAIMSLTMVKCETPTEKINQLFTPGFLTTCEDTRSDKDIDESVVYKDLKF